MTGVHRRVITGAVLLALALAVFFLCAVRVRQMAARLPRAAVLESADGIGVAMERAPSLNSRRNPMSLCAVSVPLSGVLAGEGGNTARVSAAFATPADSGLLPYTYTYGNWFLDWDAGAQALAVIPQSLSLAFFGTADPAGGVVHFDGAAYAVCGVYRENTGLLADLSGDGSSRVYLSGPGGAAQPIGALYFSDPEGSDGQTLLSRAMAGGQTVLRGELTDYRQRIDLARALLGLELLVCAVFLAALLFLSGARLILSGHRGARLGAAVRGGRIAAGSGVLLLTFLGLYFALGLLDIPSAYLPKDNIFDFAHYRGMIVGFFHGINGRGPAGHWDRTFAALLISNLCAGLLGCAAFAAGTLMLWRAAVSAAGCRRVSGARLREKG